ncbi:fructose-6-phosphate aldolase [soil metagenome]
MELYIDTANLDEIKEAADMGVLDGVTTNPSLIAKEKYSYAKRLKEICDLVPGPVSAEVIALDFKGMMAEGREHAKIAPNIVVKLPCTVDGLKACKAFSDDGVKTNLTLCFQPLQAMMVAKAGAFLVSPFIGRLDDIAEDGMDLIQRIRTIYDNYGFRTKILAASIRHAKHLVECALAGADVATVPMSVIKTMMNHPLTDSGLKKFVEDYQKAFPTGAKAAEDSGAKAKK